MRPTSIEHFERLRESLMDAACSRLADCTWDELTVVEIARTAGVPRQLYYKVFKSRQQLVQALVLREKEAFMRQLERALSSQPRDSAAAIAAAVGMFLHATEHNPFVRALVRREGASELQALLVSGTPSLHEHARTRIAAALADNHPSLRSERASLIAELLVRLAVSCPVAPANRSRLTADATAKLLRPYLDADTQATGLGFMGGLEAEAPPVYMARWSV